MRSNLTRFAFTWALVAFVASAAWAADTTITAYPSQVPDETPPRVNVGDYPAGFAVDSWQGPATGKSNWHARYIDDGDYLSDLFPAEAATMTVADLAEVRYQTKRPMGTPAGRDWWVQIYTRPLGNCIGAPPCDKASWYHDRFINNYASHTDIGNWVQYSTSSGMTFQSNGHGGPVMTLGDFITAHGTEEIMMFSVQTDSGWNGYDGYLDALEVELTNGSVGHVNFEDEPAVPASSPLGVAIVALLMVAALSGVFAFRKLRTA